MIHIHEMIVSSITSEYMKYNVQCTRVSNVLDDTSTDNNNVRVTVGQYMTISSVPMVIPML